MKKLRLLKVGSVFMIVIIGAVSMFFLGSTKKESKKRDKVVEARLVETQDIEFGNVMLEVKGNGVIESKRNLEFVSEANGKVMFAKNDLKDGTFANEGDILLNIDSREVKNQLFSLRSEFMN